MTDWVIEGARVVLPHDVVETDVQIVDGVIAAVGRGGTGRRIDGRGRLLGPAFIDIHGDAFERQLMPRPGVFFPIDAALLETDRQLAGNGITTAYHAVTLSWEPGLRSVERGAAMIDALNALASRLSVENRVQLRWETFAFEAIELVERALAGPLTPAVAFNDHTSMSMRAFDVAVQDRAFEGSPDFSVAALDDARMKSRTAGSAERAGLGVEEYVARLAEVWTRRDGVSAAISRVAEAGRRADAPMLSHDDTRGETREFYRRLGARIAEFPMTTEVACAAHQAGDATVFGAPNVVRGGSHLGSPSAADMIEDGLCDILASDYFYPSMLTALARLHGESRAGLHDLWALASRNPARASMLSDRGAVAEGLRADLILVDWPEHGTPAVSMTLAAGELAYMAKGVRS